MGGCRIRLRLNARWGTGMIIQSATALDDGFRSKLDAFIDGYESVLSRFRADSLVTAMGESSHGGSFDFPDWASGLFDLADAFCTVDRRGA